MRTVLFVGCLCLVVSVGFVLTSCGAGEEEAIAQTTCPVMGRNISKNIHEDYKGKRVYFCCNGCPATFKADPEKFMKKMADEGTILEVTERHIKVAYTGVLNVEAEMWITPAKILEVLS